MLVGLGVTRAVLSYVYRNGLFRLAYHIEADLRSILFGHMSRLSFSFYDRVQSGQLISRANSDIRSVQMVLAFAPLMALSILSFARGARLHAEHPRRAHDRRRRHPADRLRRRREAAQRGLPAVVDHPVPDGRHRHDRRRERQRCPGGQVLRRRGAPDLHAGPCGREAPVEHGRDRQRPGPVRPGDGEPAPVRVGPRAALRRVAGHRGSAHGGHPGRLQRLHPAAADARSACSASSSCSPSGPPRRPIASTRSSTNRSRSWTAPTPSRSIDPTGTSASSTSASPTPATSRSWTGWTWTSRRARRWRWWAGPGRARRP